jgi:hypothetical protein
MLHETRNQLKAAKSKMHISFVLLADQINVYDAFVKCLNEMESIDMSISHTTSSKKNDEQLSIPFDRKSNIILLVFSVSLELLYLAVKITLISSNDNHLIKCKEDILNLVQSYSITSRVETKEMLDWSQEAINKYYRYCLEQRVIPTLDLDKTIRELVGWKDAVIDLIRLFVVVD